VDSFERGRTRLDNEERSGRPSPSRTGDHSAEADVLIKENRRTTVSEITLTLGISYGSVTMKLRTRRLRGSVHKRKLSSQMGSEGL